MKAAKLTLEFPKQIYSAEAVKLAAYVFAGRVDVGLADCPGGVRAELPAADRAAAGEFANEVLNQQCRLDLAVLNGKISGAIVTKALLSSLGETKGGK